MQRVLALGVAAAALTAGPVSAAATLTVDGVGYAATASGWLDPGASAPSPAPMSLNRRGYFSFVIMPGVHHGDPGFTGDDAGLASETRTLINYTLYDLEPLPSIRQGPGGGSPPDVQFDASTAATVYTDAGSGTVYGTATVTLPSAGTAELAPPIVITLNAAGLAALNTAAETATPFFVGVALTAPITPGVGPAGVPEPGTWLLQIAGLGLVGAASRRQRERLFAGSFTQR